MKVLITGATGLVGSAIVSQCHNNGYVVHYLTTSKDKIESRSNYKGFYWNPSKNKIDDRCFDGVEVIINLAGASISKRWTKAYKKTILNSRIDSLQTLKTALKNYPKSKVHSLVSASAIGIYPNSQSNLYEEDNQHVDNSFLGKVVDAWEDKVDEFCTMGLNISKIRIGLVLSQNGGALPEMAKPVKYYVGAAFGSGEQWQSWIHIKDLANMFLFVAFNKLEGVYNGVGPNPITNNKLINEIAKVMDKPLFLPNIPSLIMYSILGKMAYILFASQRVSSKKIEEEGFIFSYPNICAALQSIYEKDGECKSVKSELKKEYVS